MSERPAEWSSKVLDSLQKWEKEAEQLCESLEGFRQRLSPEQCATVGKLNPFLLDMMMKASGHCDKGYVDALLKEFPVTGSVNAHGTGIPRTRLLMVLYLT